MTIPFNDFFQRVKEATDIGTQMGLADALGVNRSAITQAKLRDAVPQKWILSLARRYALSPDWLEFGTGASSPARRGAAGTRPGLEQSGGTSELLIYVPKVRAQLCAGGGSFEVEAVPVSQHPLPHAWLSRMGSPSSMVFMDVVGNSMEPGIMDGDMVLVDQSNRAPSPHSVHAVGVEDSIYLKRVEPRNKGIILHSDNPGYADMELYGDELETFRIIGKVVWLCRDCRYY